MRCSTWVLVIKTTVHPYCPAGYTLELVAKITAQPRSMPLWFTSTHTVADISLVCLLPCAVLDQ